VLNLDDVDEILNTINSTGHSAEEVINNSLMESHAVTDLPGQELKGTGEISNNLEVTDGSTSQMVVPASGCLLNIFFRTLS
jgi:hypothetical protein